MKEKTAVPIIMSAQALERGDTQMALELFY
jgi:hypothetical protein